MTQQLLLQIATWNVAVPLALSTTAAAVGWQLWRRGSPTPGSGWHGAAPLAFGLAMYVGSVGLLGFGKFPPVVAEGWLRLVALGAAVLAGVAAAWSAGAPVRWGVAVLCAGAAAALPFWAYLTREHGSVLGWAIVAGLAAVIVALWAALEPLAERAQGWVVPAGITAWATLASVALAGSGSVTLGHQAGMLAAAAGPWIVAGWLRPDLTLSRGAMAVAVSLLGGLLILGRLFSDLPTAAAVLVAIAPAALWLHELPAVKSWNPWLRAFVALGAMVTLAAAGAGVAIVMNLPDGSEYQY